MLGENALVSGAELHHQLLFLIVGHYRNVHVYHSVSLGVDGLQPHQRRPPAAEAAGNVETGHGRAAAGM